MLNNSSSQSSKKKLTPTMRVVLTAAFVALSTVINSYATIRIGTQFKLSLILIVYFMAGYILGGGLGLVVGFCGDLLGWLIFPDGAYNPIIGISNGLLALIPGVLFGLKRPFKREIKAAEFIIKAVIAYLIGFFVCTVFLSSLGIWLYSSYIQGKYGTLLVWLAYRMGAQCLNTIVNAALTIVIFLPLKRVKGIKEYL